jgi:methylthioribose-1-phosphate isomerase
MKMRGSCCIFVFASWLIVAASSAADDTDALQYAEDGVATLQQEYERLHDAASAGSISATDLQRREDDLLEARLLLLRLKNDTDGVTGLLRDDVDRRKEQLQRIEKIAERGYVGTDQVSDATLRVLCAQLRVATHTNDQELKTATLKTAVATEEKKLKSMIDLASKGYASRSAIAAQKLRIARIIADQEIAMQ